MKLTIQRGDITTVSTDAIVNAANMFMLGGGGVDGAIHRAAGPELVEACRLVPEVLPDVRCPVGEAHITGAYKLPAKYVIHTVGPQYSRSSNPTRMLMKAYYNSMKLAQAHGCRTVTFPAISCGVYGYPLMEAAKIALCVLTENDWDMDEVRFVMFDEVPHAVWLQVAQDMDIELEDVTPMPEPEPEQEDSPRCDKCGLELLAEGDRYSWCAGD